MFSIVLEKSNVVGVWYTYDQIILTGMADCYVRFTTSVTTYFLLLESQGTDTSSPSVTTRSVK